MPLTSDHNSRLKKLLAELRLKTAAAASQQDLLHVINAAKQFAAPLRYRNHIPYSIAAILLLIVAGIVLFQQKTTYAVPNFVWPLSIILLASAVLSVIFAIKRNRQLPALSRTIFDHKVLFDNQLKKLPLNDITQKLLSNFREFQRGNHSRKIEQLYQGLSEHNGSSFHYYFYHFHYVNRRKQTYTVNNSVRTRTVYDHYHRYGIYLPQFQTEPVLIYSDAPDKIQGVSYRPASNRFNKQYKVWATEEIAAARFLTPAVVVACEDILSVLNKPNIEVNDQVGLCLSFKDDNMLQVRQQYSLAEPDLFRQEIAQPVTLDKLQQALHFIHYLAKHLQ